MRIRSKKTEYSGFVYDSAFEASIAKKLRLLVRAGEYRGFDNQYKCVMNAHGGDGEIVWTRTHKVDFRLHNNNGSYTLLEAKGFETAAHKEIQKWLKVFWLPANLEYDYKKVYQSKQMFKKSDWEFK